MAVSFNAIHKKCKASYSKTLEDICNRYRSTPEMYKNTIFRPYAYQPVGNRESWERKPTKHSGNQNYDAEKSGKILRSKVELKSLQHYNSSPLYVTLYAIAFQRTSPQSLSDRQKSISKLVSRAVWDDLLVSMKQGG